MAATTTTTNTIEMVKRKEREQRDRGCKKTKAKGVKKVWQEVR